MTIRQILRDLVASHAYQNSQLDEATLLTELDTLFDEQGALSVGGGSAAPLHYVSFNSISQQSLPTRNGDNPFTIELEPTTGFIFADPYDIVIGTGRRIDIVNAGSYRMSCGTANDGANEVGVYVEVNDVTQMHIHAPVSASNFRTGAYSNECILELAVGDEIAIKEEGTGAGAPRDFYFTLEQINHAAS